MSAIRGDGLCSPKQTSPMDSLFRTNGPPLSVTRYPHWPIWLVVALALAFRLAGSRGALPYLYNPGESIVVRQALAYGTGTLRPYTFIYPPLYSYILFGLYGAYFLLGKVLGLFPNVVEFAISYFLDPTPFYWMGRIVTALLGTATVGLAYGIGCRAYDRTVGLLSGLFLAVSHLHVTHSHYVLTDVPMTFLVALAIWLLLRAVERSEAAAWSWTGLAAGVATAMKYPAALTLSAAAIGTWLWARRAGASAKEALARLIRSGLFAALGFALANPYALLDFRIFWQELVDVQVSLNVGTAKSFQEAMFFYGRTLLRSGLELPLGVLAIAGVIYLFWRHRWQDLLLALFLVIYLLFLGVQGRYQPNWLLPVLPFFCLAAAMLVVEVSRKLCGTSETAFRRCVTLAALVLIALPTWYSFFLVKSSYAKDTRTLAKEWVEAHIPAGSKILLDSATTGPPLNATEGSLLRYFQRAEQDKAIPTRPEVAQEAFGNYQQYQLEAARRRAREGVAYDLDYMQLAWWRAEESAPDLEEFPVFGVYRERIYTLEQLREAGFDYVIASSFQYRKYLTPEGEERWPSYYSFYRSLDEELTLVQEFIADPIHQPGPDIKIYAMRGGT